MAQSITDYEKSLWSVKNNCHSYLLPEPPELAEPEVPADFGPPIVLAPGADDGGTLTGLPLSTAGGKLTGLKGFPRRHAATYFSNSRKVDGFRVSKSISISSGFVSLREGSRI